MSPDAQTPPAATDPYWFAHKYGLVKSYPPEERAAIQAVCEREGHEPELVLGSGSSKFVSSIAARCARCHETVEWKPMADPDPIALCEAELERYVDEVVDELGEKP